MRIIEDELGVLNLYKRPQAAISYCLLPGVFLWGKARVETNIHLSVERRREIVKAKLRMHRKMQLSLWDELVFFFQLWLYFKINYKENPRR